MSIKKFIDYLYKSGFAPFSENDIKDTMGESVLIRARDDKQGSKSLYYSYTEENGKGFGHIYSCRSAMGDYWFSKSERSWSDSERLEWEELRARKKAEAEAERLALNERVAIEASREFRSMSQAIEHQYITRKGIPVPPKSKIDNDGNLVLPAIDNDSKIWTLQRISPDGEKKFLYGGRKEGTFFPFGLRKSVTPESIFICEGVATGASIYEATNIPTICAWDAGNLFPVAKSIREKYPDSDIIIAADNDQWTIKNPRPKELADIVAADVAGDDDRWVNWARYGKLHNKGLDSAGKAGVAANARVVYPDFDARHPDKPTDFNDMHNLMGISAVKDRLLGAVNSFYASQEVVPMAVVAESPAQYAPAIGDEIEPRFYEPVSEAMFSFEKPDEVIKKRSDGNPLWFSDIIWEKEPDGLLPNVYGIKDLHDGKSLFNLITFIRGYHSGLFVLNEFSDEIIVRTHPPWLSNKELFKVHTLTDSDVINMTAYVENFGFKVGKEKLRDAIISISEKDRIHPVKQYMKSLNWDGIPRLDTWLVDYAGATIQDKKYLSSIGKKWLLAGVARTFQAGCKFDHMLVLEGKTDIGKSALLRELATFGDIEEAYFTDAVSMKDFDRPFAAMLWQGNLILEFAELDGMDKASVNTVKAWITRQEDVYQPKFSNDKKHRPRGFILAGTTNEDVWMVDTTGNKRFWPVHCTATDIKALKLVKEQLWAEAVYLYEQGERWWLADDDPVYEMARSEQSLRMVGDSWQDILSVKLSDSKWITMQDAYEYLGIPITQRDRGTDARIRGIMKVLRFEWKISYANTKHHNRVWVKE